MTAGVHAPRDPGLFYHRWVAKLDDFTFARSYFEAFNWWGRYITFPFCESLIAIWNRSHAVSDATRDAARDTTEIGDLVTQFARRIRRDRWFRSSPQVTGQQCVRPCCGCMPCSVWMAIPPA